MSLPVGKFSVDKIQHLLIHWAKTVDYKFPSLDFPSRTGLKEATQGSTAQEPAEMMQVGNLRGLKRELSEGPDPAPPAFQVGDKVTVIRRMT